LHINNDVLPVVDQVRDLGVIVRHMTYGLPHTSTLRLPKRTSVQTLFTVHLCHVT